MIETFTKLLNEYTNGYSIGGIIKLVIDVILAIVVISILISFILKKIKKPVFYLLLGIGIILYIVSLVFSLELFNVLLKFCALLLGVCLIVVYSQEIKHDFEIRFTTNKTNNAFSSVLEKQEIIDTLCNTAEYLSKRKIGALISIERNDSLNSFIEKAIPINSSINQEILTTIFYPGTACHDGAVIIRKNKIMCAGAYLPSTDKYDIPKNLGTRHRAAIGLSERYDALTIVVSEETGNISVASSGTISLGLRIDRLKEMLDGFLDVK